ncbi:MAG: hypothetical protein U0941_01470 [Planctomycetaceae bacterium]
MRRIRRIVLRAAVVLMIVPAFVGCGETNQKNRLEVNENIPAKVITESAAKEEVSFTVDLPKHAKLEGPIHAELRLQNRSESVIIIYPPMDAAHKLRQTQVEIKGENGEKVERTALGNDALMQSEFIASGPSDRLAPSETRVWKLDLERFFQLKRGTFTVTASVGILKVEDGEAKGEFIESEPTHLTVN